MLPTCLLTGLLLIRLVAYSNQQHSPKKLASLPIREVDSEVGGPYEDAARNVHQPRPDTKEYREDIHWHKDVANEIIKLAVYGAAKGQTYTRLAELVDTFGPRMSGSHNLEDAIDYMLVRLKEDGLENVHAESAMVPHWVRGSESAHMLKPRPHEMSILGLGGSIGTPTEGITAEVLVVTSFAELKAHADQAKGKIIVYNQPYIDYNTSVKYRKAGAVEAAKVGGVAALIRSVTPFSINSPHTGQMDYDENVKKIPAACITVEDAEMLHRIANRGTPIVINLKMSAENLPMVKSRNTIAEIEGWKYPEQVVIVSGHFDSWDVGQGAMDDGGGVFISWQVLSLIHQLGLRPKRTLRLVMWTAEEQGAQGGKEYFETHKKDINNYDLVMESDMGTFSPYGIKFTGNAEAAEVMKMVLELLAPINATKLSPGGDGADISLWIDGGVPGASLDFDRSKYFYFHHSAGDTMTVLDSGELDLCAAVWAVTAFVVADLENMLPRDVRMKQNP